VGLGAHFLPNVSVLASKYLEHKWNLLVIKDAFAVPFFHYFRPIDGVFICGFYSLFTININMVRFLVIFETGRLLNIEFFIDIAIEKCTTTSI